MLRLQRHLLWLSCLVFLALGCGQNEVCNDGVDNDADGLVDCVDDQCADDAACENFVPTEVCDDGVDNDADGLLDCVDIADCPANQAPCQQAENSPGHCVDGIDNDVDGTVDCQDTDCRSCDANGVCTGDPACNQPPADCTDPANAVVDSDCDALSDQFECSTTYGPNQLQTDANRADTDQDGISDGIESGKASGVQGSVCGTSTPLDADPATTTDPTDSDTDNDGREDGCEDANHNGRVDAGEMNPNDSDSDNDGIPDNVEDANGNCAVDPGETSAGSADTDQDGINDGIEQQNGTNPSLADSDADGIPDGIEDSNQDGIVNTGETDPNLADTDGDGIPDGVEDANHNGTVDAGETDPASADTDQDGLSDAEEIAIGTNPLDADSDNDGLEDGAEVALGSNPAVADSDGDGLTDGDEVAAGTNPNDPTDPDPQVGTGINDICSANALKPVQFQNDAAGDWAVALETDYTYASVTVTGTDRAATFQELTEGNAGFVVNIPTAVAGTNAFTQSQALVARLTGGAAALGASAVVQNNGATTTSFDNFSEVVGTQVIFTANAAIDPSSFRNKVMAVISGHALGDFTGLPGAGGAGATTFTMQFVTLVRTNVNPTRLVVMGSLVNKASFDNNALAARLEIEDISNGTALALAFSGNTNACNPFEVNALPAADFIWMADISGSTDDDRGTIATASGVVFSALANNGVDFRMGVVPHIENRNAQGGNAGDMRSGFTRNQNTFINDLNNTGGSDGCEYGLTAIDDALNKALPRTAPGVENALKVRDGVQLVVFYVSDEHAQEVESSAFCSPNPPLATAQSEGTRTTPNATQAANINTIVQPFINRLNTENAIAFGQLTPLQAPFCAGNNEDGQGYIQVVTATGGSFYQVCDANPGAVLQDIVDAVTGAASSFVLSDRPISATLKVGLVRAGTTTTIQVPRSLSSGFDYDAGANTIFFRGATFLPAIGDSVIVSYRLWQDPVGPGVCDAPLVLNPVTNQCECPNDCGVSGGCTGGTICNTDPNVCECQCTADCNGICGGNTVCDQNSCGCICEDTTPGDGVPDCGGTCTGNTECDPNSCGCVCGDANDDGTADCNNNCIAPRVCDAGSCACICPADCGGCPAGTACNPTSCSCEDIN